jgi:hypothetical protein
VRELDGEWISKDVSFSELESWVIRDSIAFSLISKTSSGDVEKAGEVGDWCGRGTFAFRFTFFRMKLERIMLSPLKIVFYMSSRVSWPGER